MTTPYKSNRTRGSRQRTLDTQRENPRETRKRDSKYATAIYGDKGTSSKDRNYFSIYAKVICLLISTDIPEQVYRVGTSLALLHQLYFQELSAYSLNQR